MIGQTDSPAFAANKVHNFLGWSNPDDFTVDEMALALNIMVRDIPIEGSEGRILIDGDSAIMSVSSSINYAPKRNFVVAHEIGHFILHKNITKLFSDNEKTLSDWFQNGPHEQQANEFAAELLMPEQMFKSKLGKRKLNLALVQELSTYFKTSLTATFLRYVKCGDFPLMIVFIEAGVVKWKSVSTDFPFPFLPLNSEVPVWSVAGDYYHKKQYENEPEKVDAIEWFPKDFKAPNVKLWEQCYPVSSSGFISCLWTD